MAVYDRDMRARNLQTLTDAVKRRYPGVVVYGIGDAAHRARASDHNEDDTSGSRAAQSDSDDDPEHRAIDIMIGPALSKAQAHELVKRLVADPDARRRLFYIIFDGSIWSRSYGWDRRAFDGDPHPDHVHVSGWAAQDENDAVWTALEDDVAWTDSEREKINALHADVRKMLTMSLAPDNALAYWVRSIANRDDPMLRQQYPDWNPIASPGLMQIMAALTAQTATLTRIEQGDDLDESAVAEAMLPVILAALTPEKIAAALPGDVARQVADELSRRLADQ